MSEGARFYVTTAIDYANGPHRDGTVPAGAPTSLDAAADRALERYRTTMDASLLHHGAAALDLAGDANGFVEERAPWQLARDPGAADRLDATLASLARTLAHLATMLEPFLPSKMPELASRLGLDGVPRLADLATLSLAGRSVQGGAVLFPKPER